MCCFIPLVLGFVAGRSCDFRCERRHDCRCFDRVCCKDRCCVSECRGRRC